jgi:hypothetical protein
LLATACASFGPSFRFQPTTPRFAATEEIIPTVRFGDAFLVPVMIEDRGPFQFLLDTGSGATVVGLGLAETFSDRVVMASGTITGATGETLEAEKVLRGLDLRAGPVTFSGVDAIVLDLSGPAAAIGRNVDGILGYPMFVELVLTVDWTRSEVRVSRQPLPDVDGLEILALQHGYRPMVQATLSGRDEVVLVDSGSSGSISFPWTPDAGELAAGPISWFGAVTVTGREASSVMARLSGDLVLGGARVPRPVARISPGTSSLGTRILRDFEVTFDPSRGRVRFRPAAGGPSTGASLRGIGAAMVADERRWRVVQVLPGSPAEAAGLKEGDIVLTIDGHVPGEVDWYSLFEARSTVNLMLPQEDGGQRSVNLPVITYL